MRDIRTESKAGSRRQRSVDEAEAMLARYEESGLTQRVFAQRMGIGVSTLQYWLRRERLLLEEEDGGKARSKKTAGFSLLEVELAPQKQSSHCAAAPVYEIEFAAGARLRIPGGFAGEEVRRLVAVLREEG